jgi:hypothetical protein
LIWVIPVALNVNIGRREEPGINTQGEYEYLTGCGKIMARKLCLAKIKVSS